VFNYFIYNFVHSYYFLIIILILFSPIFLIIIARTDIAFKQENFLNCSWYCEYFLNFSFFNGSIAYQLHLEHFLALCHINHQHFMKAAFFLNFLLAFILKKVHFSNQTLIIYLSFDIKEAIYNHFIFLALNIQFHFFIILLLFNLAHHNIFEFLDLTSLSVTNILNYFFIYFDRKVNFEGSSDCLPMSLRQNHIFINFCCFRYVFLKIVLGKCKSRKNSFLILKQFLMFMDEIIINL
jgi:hypothetical protein